MISVTKALGSTTDVSVDDITADSVTATGTDGFIASGNGGKDTVALSNTTANVGITIGGDVELYRPAANTLRLDDSFQVQGAGSNLEVGSGSSFYVNTQQQMHFRDATNSYISMVERGADPSAPGANTGLIYMKDNGSGKTQLVVRFPTGAVQVLATEP